MVQAFWNQFFFCCCFFFFLTSNHLFSRFVGQLRVDCSQLDMVGGSVETVWALLTHLEVSWARLHLTLIWLFAVSLIFLLANLNMFSWQWQRIKRASPIVQALSSFWLCRIPLVTSKDWAQGEGMGSIFPLQWKELRSYMAKAMDMGGRLWRIEALNYCKWWMLGRVK